MSKDLKVLLSILTVSLVGGVAFIAVMAVTTPAPKPAFPVEGWTYGEQVGLFRTAEKAAGCQAVGGAARAWSRAAKARDEAGSLDDLVRANRDARKADQRVARAVSACEDAILTLEPDVKVTVLGREGSAFRVALGSGQQGYISEDHVTTATTK
jgi:hypothetical protein